MSASKKLSLDIVTATRAMPIVSRLIVAMINSIRPQGYGVKHIGLAMERIAIVSAVRKCECDGVQCTAAQISKSIGVPDSSVRAALRDLVEAKIVIRDGRFYRSTMDDERERTDVNSLVEAIVEAGVQLSDVVAQSRNGSNTSKAASKR
ncbi:hypothetical protein [Bradyrhizobium sp. S3.7.6]